tara:strand:- start:177 stop:401 length:225 start_codon:yes stop_codon:yes gene_type:complete
MCLGGGGGTAYEPQKVLPRVDPPPGPPSPDDMVNNQVVDNANKRSEQQANRLADATPDQKKKLKIQSDKNPGLM